MCTPALTVVPELPLPFCPQAPPAMPVPSTMTTTAFLTTTSFTTTTSLMTATSSIMAPLTVTVPSTIVQPLTIITTSSISTCPTTKADPSIHDNGKTTRPVCGGFRTSAKEYDLSWHLGALSFTLVVSCLAVTSPLIIKIYNNRYKMLERLNGASWVCRYLCIGVIVTVAFSGLLPDASEKLSDPCLPSFFTDTKYVLTSAIGLGAYFLLMAMQMLMQSVAERRKKTSTNTPRESVPAAGLGDEESQHTNVDRDQSLRIAPNPALRTTMVDALPPALLPFENKVRPSIPSSEDAEKNSRDCQPGLLDDRQPRPPTASRTIPQSTPSTSTGMADARNRTTQPWYIRRKTVDVLFLESGVFLHSFFLGMVVGVTRERFVPLVITFACHQLLQGHVLSTKIAEVPWDRSRWRYFMGLWFGGAGAIGQAVGIGLWESWDTKSPIALILTGIIKAFGVGLVGWTGLIDLVSLDQEQQSTGSMKRSRRWIAWGSALIGAVVMVAIVQFVK